jgi:hypothetical protein
MSLTTNTDLAFGLYIDVVAKSWFEQLKGMSDGGGCPFYGAIT